MGLLKWFEKKAFLGEIIKDFGIIDENKSMGVRNRISAVMCKKNDKLQLVFRISRMALFGIGVQYVHIDITKESMQKLGDVIQEAKTYL